MTHQFRQFNQCLLTAKGHLCWSVANYICPSNIGSTVLPWLCETLVSRAASVTGYCLHQQSSTTSHCCINNFDFEKKLPCLTTGCVWAPPPTSLYNYILCKIVTILRKKDSYIFIILGSVIIKSLIYTLALCRGKKKWRLNSVQAMLTQWSPQAGLSHRHKLVPMAKSVGGKPTGQHVSFITQARYIHKTHVLGSSGFPPTLLATGTSLCRSLSHHSLDGVIFSPA